MKRLRIVLLVMSLCACGSKSPSTPSPSPTPTPTPTPTPAPAPITVGYFAGMVTETAPTASTPVVNAVVSITDGVNAGKAQLTSSSGQFTIDPVTFGTFNVRIEKAGYDTRNVNVTLTASGNQNYQLSHTPATITEVLTGAVSGGDATCVGSPFTKPCKRFTLNAHTSGTITARLVWTGSSNDLDLELWRGGTKIASSDGVRSEETISSSAAAGTAYELRVVYYEGSTVANFTVNVTRPN